MVSLTVLLLVVAVMDFEKYVILSGFISNTVFSALILVTPVPPLVTGNVPVTPGLGDVAKTEAALVDVKLTKRDGFEVTPVPPRATASVPEVMLEAA